MFSALCRNHGQTTGIIVFMYSFILNNTKECIRGLVQHINQNAAAMHDAEKERKLHIMKKLSMKHLSVHHRGSLNHNHTNISCEFICYMIYSPNLISAKTCATYCCDVSCRLGRSKVRQPQVSMAAGTPNMVMASGITNIFFFIHTCYTG